MSVTYLPLEAWNRHWFFEEGSVCCRRCLATQLVTDLNPFEHVLGCKAQALNAEYPSRELVVLLKQEAKIKAAFL
ncbi:hypothetical protein ACIQYF_23590 [Pseudomonas sp. NPDC096917]|uniref:hypothetical protein n=1 Tax=Pseudomonas sp. NPDC096917 TaxID=3364483 RepID=UPI00383AF6EC